MSITNGEGMVSSPGDSSSNLDLMTCHWRRIYFTVHFRSPGSKVRLDVSFYMVNFG